MDERLRTAYATAMHARHASNGVVAISLGSAVLDHLKALATEPDPSYAGATPKVWGFPILEADPKLGPDHISVHDIQTIH